VTKEAHGQLSVGFFRDHTAPQFFGTIGGPPAGEALPVAGGAPGGVAMLICAFGFIWEMTASRSRMA
jgi:hypothetical protein